MVKNRIMQESEGYVKWRNARLSQPETTPGVPIDFLGDRYNVCITDDGRMFIQLPCINQESAAA